MHGFLLLAVFFALPQSAFAVLPPDILFSVGTQVWQIVAGVGALLAGTLASIFLFLRNATFPNIRLQKILSLSGATLVLFGFGYLLFALSAPGTSIRTPAQSIVGTTTGFEFYANRFVLLGTTEQGKRILINMDINRKEIGGGDVIHYYFVDVINGTSTKSIYKEEVLRTHETGEHFFFTTFKRKLPEDHSAREQFNFSFTDDGHTYDVETELLTADFLVKNEPSYTAYVNAGKAVGFVDGERVNFQVMSERIYSNDYRVSVFFDAEGLLRSESTQFVLWDEKEDFYMVDRSIVTQYSPVYTSHFWGLTKNSDGWTRRYFEGETVALDVGGVLQFRARLGTHDDDKEFALSMVQKFDNGHEEGYVTGTMRLPGSGGEVRNVYGLGTHRYYGKE